MRILIAVPTYENIYPDTFKSIWDMEKPCETGFEFVRGYDCASARNNIARLAGPYDYVFMVDNDMIIPRSALTLMLEGGEDVVLGYYAHREEPYDGKTNVCRLGEYNYTNQYRGVELKSFAQNNVNRIQVHGGGLGCALIKTSVFDKIDYPYFDWINYDSGYVLSEDLFFAERCTKAGIPIWCDTRVECGHIFRHAQYTEI